MFTSSTITTTSLSSGRRCSQWRGWRVCFDREKRVPAWNCSTTRPVNCPVQSSSITFERRRTSLQPTSPETRTIQMIQKNSYKKSKTKQLWQSCSDRITREFKKLVMNKSVTALCLNLEGKKWTESEDGYLSIHTLALPAHACSGLIHLSQSRSQKRGTHNGPEASPVPKTDKHTQSQTGCWLTSPGLHVFAVWTNTEEAHFQMWSCGWVNRCNPTSHTMFSLQTEVLLYYFSKYLTAASTLWP